MGSDHRPIVTFNPACCLMTRATKQITWRRNDHSSTSTSSSSSVFTSSSSSSSSHDQPKKNHRRSGSNSDEPSSPRVGCMGQIKGRKGALNGSPLTKNNKIFKLKRIFSGRSMATAMAMPTAAGDDSSVSSKISIEDLDPPLPVTKHVARDCISVSLWKRRCGQELDNLQLQQLQQQQQIYLV